MVRAPGFCREMVGERRERQSEDLHRSQWIPLENLFNGDSEKAGRKQRTGTQDLASVNLSIKSYQYKEDHWWRRKPLSHSQYHWGAELGHLPLVPHVSVVISLWGTAKLLLLLNSDLLVTQFSVHDCWGKFAHISEWLSLFHSLKEKVWEEDTGELKNYGGTEGNESIVN